MSTTTDSNLLALPADLLAEVQAAAHEEHRSVDDLVRDFVEHGLSERRVKAHAAQEFQRARELGLPEHGDVVSEDEYRRSVRSKIAEGMQSLRQGQGTDGEAFIAEMSAELDELARQGR